MHRDDALDRLRSEEFDLLVVGGGITGAGVAHDAALRGLSVALIEKEDFGAGTSSKSSKLLHGGLRYLAHLEAGLVREALTERGVMLRLAPHLCRPTPFLIPRYGKRRLIPIRAGLSAYDVLAIGSTFPRHTNVGPEDVPRMAPALRDDSLGGIVYWDARTDDTRLTWTVARTAIEHGAAVVNHARVVAFDREGDRIRGATIRDAESNETIDVRVKVVVNATGVWSDDIRTLEDPDERVWIRPSKGIHVVVSQRRLPVNAALLVPAPDGRYVFVIPWEPGRVVVGTTDEDYTGPLDAPRARYAEIDYLLDVLNRVIEDPLTHDDVIATFAGLRPLIQKPGQTTKDLSRRHKVLVGPGGVVTITGGKMTTWRPMASDAVDAALEVGGLPRRHSTTDHAHLVGGELVPGLKAAESSRAQQLGLDPRQGERLVARYGARATEVLGLVEIEPDLGGLLDPQRPYLKAEAAYAIAYEEARTPADVLERRLRMRITARHRGLDALDWVTERLAKAFGWDEDRRRREAASYEADVRADMEAERT